MLNKKKFLEEEKECAEMLGLTLEEYRDSIKKTKIPAKEKETKYTFDNTILVKMGLDESILKKKKISL